MSARTGSAAAYGLGITAGLAPLLVAAWLMLAPFVLGFAPDGGDWGGATIASFYTGLGVAVATALAGLTVGVLLLRRPRGAAARNDDHRADDMTSQLAALSAQFRQHVEHCNDGIGRDSAAPAPVLATVAGTVTGTSTAVPYALVTLIDAHGDVVASATTGRDGIYRLSGARGGTHTLTAAAEDYQPVAVTVEVPDGAHLDRDLELRAYCRLLGTVRAAGAGGGLPDALVSLTDPSGPVVQTTLTAADGTYVFDHVVEGEYTLVAAGYDPQTTPVRLSDPAASGNALTVDFALQPPHPHRVGADPHGEYAPEPDRPAG